MRDRGQRGAEDHRNAPEGRGVRGRRHHRLWEVSVVVQRRPTGGNREQDAIVRGSGGDRAVGHSNAPPHTGKDTPKKEEDEFGQEEGRGWSTKLEAQPAQLPD